MTHKEDFFDKSSFVHGSPKPTSNRSFSLPLFLKLAAIFLFCGVGYLLYSHFQLSSPPPPIPGPPQPLSSCPNHHPKQWKKDQIFNTLSDGLKGYEEAVKQTANILQMSLSGKNDKATVLHFLGPNHEAKKALLNKIKHLIYDQNFIHILEFSQEDLKEAQPDGLKELNDKVLSALKLCNTTLIIVNCTKEAREAIYEFEPFFDMEYFSSRGQKQRLTSAIFILLTDVAPEKGDRRLNTKEFFNREAFVGRILTQVTFHEAPSVET